MEKFKVIFRTVTEYSNGQKMVKEIGCVRVIAAKDQQTAARIARAMEDEAISTDERLDSPALVELTGEDYVMVSYDTKETWRRALEKMGVDERDVKWVYSDNRPDEIVGFEMK